MVKKEGPTIRVAAYCRVSTDKEEQLDSLVHQKEFFDGYAEKNGYNLVKIYADEGISGTSLKKRDEFLRLMKDAKLGLFDAVVVKDVSRLSRNTVDFLQSIRTLKSYGINTIFLTANMDTLGESEFVLTMFGAMAQEESANLSKRVKFGKKINAQKGRVPQRIFGYDRVDNFTLRINEDEAETVRTIYNLFLSGELGSHGIAVWLNNHNRLTKFGHKWDPQGVRRILRNPIYYGHYVNHKFEVKNYLVGKLEPLPKEQYYHHDRPEWAIISKEEFDKAQTIIADRLKKYNPDNIPAYKGSRYSTKYVFSTLIKCEHCGRSFCRKHYTNVNTRIYWVCTTFDQKTSISCDNNIKINESDMLQAVRNYLEKLIGDENALIKEILSSLNSNLPASEPECDIEKINTKVNKLLSKKEKYQEMYANDILTMAELKEKISVVTKELQALEYGRAMIEKRKEILGNKEELISYYTKQIRDVLSMDTITNVDMRKIIDHITVNKSGKIKIYIKKFDDIGTL